MRVAPEARKVISREMGRNWRSIAISPNYDHYTDEELKRTKFCLTPALRLPALPLA